VCAGVESKGRGIFFANFDTEVKAEAKDHQTKNSGQISLLLAAGSLAQ